MTHPYVAYGFYFLLGMAAGFVITVLVLIKKVDNDDDDDDNSGDSEIMHSKRPFGPGFIIFFITCCVALFNCSKSNAQVYPIGSVGFTYGQHNAEIDSHTAFKPRPKPAGFINAGVGFKKHFEWAEKYLDVHVELNTFIFPANGDMPLITSLQAGVQVPVFNRFSIIGMAGGSIATGNDASIKPSIDLKGLFTTSDGNTQWFIEPGYRNGNGFLGIGFIILANKLL